MIDKQKQQKQQEQQKDDGSVLSKTFARSVPSLRSERTR